MEKDGKRKNNSVINLKQGDKIVVADGSLATLKCLVRIPRTKILFVLPGGLAITGSHPMRINGEWTTARKLGNTVEMANPSGYVYNMVLDRAHIPLVNGIQCCTWGHGLTEEGVQHDYYGTDRVL